LTLGYRGAQLAGSLEYAADLYEFATAERMVRHWERLLKSAVDDPERLLGGLEMLSPGERQQLLVDWNDTAVEYPHEQRIHELFEEQAEKRPEAIALVHEERSLSYGELNARANRLAAYLRELGVGPDARVAICMDRGIEMMAALLATLKAGGAYVPLDPAYPPERLIYMLEDSAPTVLLTNGSVRSVLNWKTAGVSIIDFDTDVARWASGPEWNLDQANVGLEAQGLAYIIYTSGSTGRPKGVMVGRRGVVNLLRSMSDVVKADSNDILLALTTLAFDIAGLELYLPLIHGGRTWLVDQADSQDPVALADLIRKSSATVMQATPATWRMLLDSGWQGEPGLKVLSGGEALPTELSGRIVERVGKLWNVYGPTETTIWSSVAEVSVADGRESRVNELIGRPIWNTQFYILGEKLEVSPIGASGKIYIGGDGVTRGYFNRPELTAERFLPDPFGREPGGRMYVTGDLGRWHPDSKVEFLGRNDCQVKIRGFRIELGEVETNLVGHPKVREAVVVVREDGEGDKRLVAYFTGEEVGAETLRAHVSSRLPEYMVPSAYVRLEAMPLTPNGKLDRRALPDPEGGAYVRREYEAPQGEVEAALARIWAELLGIERVGRRDNFFSLGGHSLMAIPLLERMRRQGMRTDLQALFSTTDLADLALASEESEMIL
jgi:amino acid adenylation domain-containing protein